MNGIKYEKLSKLDIIYLKQGITTHVKTKNLVKYYRNKIKKSTKKLELLLKISLIKIQNFVKTKNTKSKRRFFHNRQ